MEMQLINKQDVNGFWKKAKDLGDLFRYSDVWANFMKEILRPEDQLVAKNCFLPSHPFRKGELTVWAGANGSGKSAVMNQFSLDVMKQGQPVLLISLEMRPEEILKQLNRMCFGRELSGEKDSRIAVEYLKRYGKMLYGVKMDNGTDQEYLFDAISYGAEKLGIKFIVIDNLMTITGGTSSDQVYQQQKTILQELKSIAVKYEACIQLVAHLRKSGAMQKDDELPSRYDISGSGDISNLADNVILVNRNFVKERRAIMEGKSLIWDEAGDMILSVDKWRSTGELTIKKLWRDRFSGQFCLDASRHLTEFLPSSVTGINHIKGRQMENLQ